MRRGIHYNSPVILTYAILCLIVLIIGEMTNHASTYNVFVAYRTSFLDPMMYLRMFTYVLGHADFDHFVGNLTMLLLIGPMVEEKYSTRPLLIMIIVTAFIGGLVHILFFQTGALGASGIVFMLILLTPFTNMKRGKIPLTFILVATIFLGRELWYAFAIDDNVSRFGHILGGVSGAVMGFFLNKQQPQLKNRKGATKNGLQRKL